MVIPEVGQADRVRNRRATVRAVEPYDSRSAQGQLHIIDVEYLDDYRYPEGEQLLWEVEATAKLLSKTTLPSVDANRPDSSDALRAFVNAHRWTRLNRLREADRIEDVEILGIPELTNAKAAEAARLPCPLILKREGWHVWKPEEFPKDDRRRGWTSDDCWNDAIEVLGSKQAVEEYITQAVSAGNASDDADVVPDRPVEKDLLGDPISTDLFGDPLPTKKKRRH